MPTAPRSVPRAPGIPSIIKLTFIVMERGDAGLSLGKAGLRTTEANIPRAGEREGQEESEGRVKRKSRIRQVNIYANEVSQLCVRQRQ